MATALCFEETNVGKRLKFTKKRFTWKFELEKTQFTIDLFISRVSGKKKILVNGDIKVETSNPMPLGSSFPLRYGIHKLQVICIGDNSYDLRIDGQSFIGLLKKSEARRVKKMNEAASQSSPGFSGVDLEELEPGQENSSYKTQFGTSWQSFATPIKPKSDVWEDYSSDQPSHTENYELPYEFVPKHPEIYTKPASKPRTVTFEESPSNNASHQKLKSVIEAEEISAPKSIYPTLVDISNSVTSEQSNIHSDLSTIPAVKPSQIPVPTDPFPKQTNLFGFEDSKPKIAINTSEALPSTIPFPPTPASVTEVRVDPFVSFNQENMPPSNENRIPDLTSQVVDLDNLHLGDRYSPAVMKKYQEANKPPTISNSANIPMNQFSTATTMHSNAISMMAFNQYMTNMMLARSMQKFT